MQKLFRKATDATPLVNLDPDNKTFEISGRSLPEDVVAFYNEVLEWIEEYGKNPLDETTVNLKLNYYNTASSKMLYEIMLRFQDISLEGHEVLIRWHYDEDDEDMEEAGEEYAEVVEDLKFEQVPY